MTKSFNKTLYVVSMQNFPLALPFQINIAVKNVTIDALSLMKNANTVCIFGAPNRLLYAFVLIWVFWSIEFTGKL